MKSFSYLLRSFPCRLCTLEKMKTRIQTWLLVIFFFFCFPSTSLTHLYFAVAVDTISSGQSLTLNQTLISKGGKFELGFFRPGISPNYYIGIWYKQISVQNKTVVWVANRDDPLTDDYPFSSELKLLENGTLALLYQSRIVWSTESTSNGIISSEAMLGDDGNLVLRTTGVKPSDIIWQSFDYPTDTFLPGLKIGYDSRSNKLLTSWKNANDPAKGLYSLQLDRYEDTFYILSNQTRYWSSGAWNGTLFSLVPELRSNYVFNFSYVKNENESYFTYGVYSYSITSRLVMHLSGQIKQYSWTEMTQTWFSFWSRPRAQCEVPGFCGAFGVCNQRSLPLCRCVDGFEPRSPYDWNNVSDFSGGCVRKTYLQCGDEVGFLEDSQQYEVIIQQSNNDFKTADDCNQSCLGDCSCNAYTFNTTCILWKTDAFDILQPLMNDGEVRPLLMKRVRLYLRVARPVSGKKPLKAYIIVLIAGSIFISILCCVFCAYKMKQRGKLKHETTETSLEDLSEEHNPEEGKLELPFFDFNTVAAATNNFSNKLGQGGFGPVYKLLTGQHHINLRDTLTYTLAINNNGRLHVVKNDSGYYSTITKGSNECFSSSSTTLVAANFGEVRRSGEFSIKFTGKLVDEREIAVKRLSRSSGQGAQEFKNELMLISKLQHRNLVRLLGYCIGREEKILLYEYMPNKSLDAFLFEPTKQILLDWSKRFSIIDGIARGLLYLHRDSRLKVIHRDLKASNILLDEEMNPKISDFGMARIFGGKQTLANTNRVVGTYGYMAPEYAMKGIFSEKSDVFSFGVMLLEILSSKKNTNFYLLEESYHLLEYVWQKWNENKVLEIMDPTLDKSYNSQELMRCIHIGLLCVQDHALDRPTMSGVVSMLCSEGTLPLPKQPAFTIERTQFSNILFSINDAVSINSVTITQPDGR